MKIQRLSEVTSLPEFRELTPEELKEAYALARAAFTAEDLQRYTELDEGVPAEEVLAELEELQRQFGKKSE
jgi:hypothetical protein